MAVDKSRAPKQKKLKESHPLKSRFAINKSKRKKLNSKNPNLVPLGKGEFVDHMKENCKGDTGATKKAKEDSKVEAVFFSWCPATQQLAFFLDCFQSASKSKLSSLELVAYKDTCMIELSKDINQDMDNFSQHIKGVFGESYKEALCDGKFSNATIEPGSPALIIISISALKSLELIRGMKVYAKECRPAKLFAKHMKVEEQVELLRKRVNIASGTPSRIKKLADMDALLLSRLAIIVLDMRSDAKGFSLLTLPQVSAEFWELFNAHFSKRIIEGSTRICFYGSAEIRHPKKTRSDN